MDIAASIQQANRRGDYKICQSIQKEYKKKISVLPVVWQLCCKCKKFMKKILKISDHSLLQVMRVLGSALITWYQYPKNKRINDQKDKIHGAYLGLKFETSEIKKELDECGKLY